MSDNKKMAAALATEYNVAVPELDFSLKTPNWVQTVFPKMLQSLVSCFNDALNEIAVGVNESLEHMQHQVNNLESINQVHSTEIATLKDAIKQKEYDSKEQLSVISNLQQSIHKNESYSRRDNLVFSGFQLDRNDHRSSETIIRQEVFKKLLNMDDQQAANIKFVRCHYMNWQHNDRRSSIIVRFESYHERTQIWNRRRALKTIYVSEDFPFEISRKRNKMRPILKAASKQPEYEKCITLKGDKLVFNGQLLTVDKLHNLPEPIHPRTLSEVRSGNVLLFGGMMSEYHELSNFYTCPITYKEKLYNCCEQAYQHSKAVVSGDKEAAEAIMRTTDPARQKFLGSKINVLCSTNGKETEKVQ